MQKTRNFSALLLVALLCSALSSCFFFPAKPWEEGMLTNTFFSTDYLAERGVCLINKGEESFEVRRGDRIAQMMFLPVAAASFIEVDSLDETERGADGFGHTGIQ